MGQDKHVGIVGVGMMGHGLAKNILKSGYALSFLVHPGNRPVEDLIALGAQGRGGLVELARDSDVVILCVTGSPEVEDIVFRPGGLIEGMGAGKTVIDCSTALPETSLKVAATLAEKGARFVDAPMTRTPKEAEEGRLNLMVGADPETFAEVRPLLEAVAENIFHAGGVSAGNRLKLLHNFLALGNSALLAEAFVCAAKGGVHLATLCDVIRTGGADSAVFRRIEPYVLTGDDSAFRFSIANAHKDLGYYAEMSHGSGIASSCAAAVQQLYTLAHNLDRDGAFVPRLLDLLGELHGVKPRLK